MSAESHIGECRPFTVEFGIPNTAVKLYFVVIIMIMIMMIIIIASMYQFSCTFGIFAS